MCWLSHGTKNCAHICIFNIAIPYALVNYIVVHVTIFFIRWLAVLFYLAFLMVTARILLSTLIAQMSNTYATVRGNARALATFHRARFLLRYLCIYERLRIRRVKDQVCQ